MMIDLRLYQEQKGHEKRSETGGYVGIGIGHGKGSAMTHISVVMRNTFPCNVPTCISPRPDDMADQPSCETCRERVCVSHVVNRDGYSLCPKCYRQEVDAAMSIANEMLHFYAMISSSFPKSGCTGQQVPMNPCDIEAKLESWLKTIREVLK